MLFIRATCSLISPAPPPRCATPSKRKFITWKSTARDTSLTSAIPEFRLNWIKLTRGGNVFSMYGSSDRVNWVQLGTSQTVSMASSVYGLGSEQSHYGYFGHRYVRQRLPHDSLVELKGRYSGKRASCG